MIDSRWMEGLSNGNGAWLLLAELSHRIANELQVAVSALHLARNSLQQNSLSKQSLDENGLNISDRPARLIEQATTRLQSFGDIHRLLDRQKGHGPLAPRLEALCRATSVFKATARGIHITLKADDVAVDEEAAWTFCVVASEFITNALKHAFPEDMPGVVAVRLEQRGDDVVLSVGDNGVGIAGHRLAAIARGERSGSGIVA